MTRAIYEKENGKNSTQRLEAPRLLFAPCRTLSRLGTTESGTLGIFAAAVSREN